MEHIENFEEFVKTCNNMGTNENEQTDKTGYESYSDDQLNKQFEKFDRNKYDMGIMAQKDFLDLKKEMKKRNLPYKG